MREHRALLAQHPREGKCAAVAAAGHRGRSSSTTSRYGRQVVLFVIERGARACSTRSASAAFPSATPAIPAWPGLPGRTSVCCSRTSASVASSGSEPTIPNPSEPSGRHRVVRPGDGLRQPMKFEARLRYSATVKCPLAVVNIRTRPMELIQHGIGARRQSIERYEN